LHIKQPKISQEKLWNWFILHFNEFFLYKQSCPYPLSQCRSELDNWGGGGGGGGPYSYILILRY
jgi:hypothetical protein